MNGPANVDVARQVADAVLYEGYLLYPYRASSSKNHARWQFGVLGPPGVQARGLGEDSSMHLECLLDPQDEPDSVQLVVHLRFLQLQHRQILAPSGEEVPELTIGAVTWLTWPEAVEQEVSFSLPLTELAEGLARPVAVESGVITELLTDEDGEPAGRVERHRWPLSASLRARTVPADGLLTLMVDVENVCDDTVSTKADATRRSFLGSHLLIEARGARFVSLLEPPESAARAAADCTQRRCWPVLSGLAGDTDLLLGLPIILYDYPQIAAESPGALFDATEIDEILTLRVLTMTDVEKAEARATDPLARDIIDRCDEMSPETLQQLHGAQRSPRWPDAGLDDPDDPEWPEFTDLREVQPPTFETEVPWWDPATDAAVTPESDVVTIAGVRVARGSLVRVHPSRRADAQDMFFADQVARVAAVVSDVDGSTHVALVLVDDPAADLHEGAGRFFYFAPDELEPLTDQLHGAQHREESET
ncbi:hypothetical protein [Nocardioides sp.]|uniref:hypothetical protein n=1 Tax=Nocardioides sp. TaxID=35761 RepID=UPI0027331A39|nr:hypothetical protein [Nocardioides sp.]MDP3891812.1 hypothetical protein [Nocardioides sp.]